MLFTQLIAVVRWINKFPYPQESLIEGSADPPKYFINCCVSRKCNVFNTSPQADCWVLCRTNCRTHGWFGTLQKGCVLKIYRQRQSLDTFSKWFWRKCTFASLETDFMQSDFEFTRNTVQSETNRVKTCRQLPLASLIIVHHSPSAVSCGKSVEPNTAHHPGISRNTEKKHSSCAVGKPCLSSSCDQQWNRKHGEAGSIFLWSISRPDYRN